MALPSSAIMRWDKSLTYQEFMLDANKEKFIALQVLPLLRKSLTGNTNFLRVKLESILLPPESTERAPYAGYKDSDFKWDKDSYNLEDHGVKEHLDDQNLERWADIIREEDIKSARAIYRLLQAIEQEVSAELFNATWPHITPAGTPFSNFAASQPIDLIEGMIKSVGDRIGSDPNALVITSEGWRKLLRSAQLEDKLKSGTNDAPDRISRTGVLSLFPELDRILIARGRKNIAANEAQPVQLGRFWDESMMMVMHINDDGLEGDLESTKPTVGRTLIDVGGIQPLPGTTGDDEPLVIMEEYRDEERRGSSMRARNFRQIKFLHKEAAELATGVL